MSDDQQINSSLTVGGEPASQPHQTSIVLGQPVSDPHDSFVLGEPVLDDAQPPIANGRPVRSPLDLPPAIQDHPNVQSDGPSVNGDPEPLVAAEPPAPVFRAQQAEGSPSDRGSIAPPSLEDPRADQPAQAAVVEPVNYMGEETQESALKEEEELGQKSAFDTIDRSAPNRGFGGTKPLIVAGMLIAVLGVVVAGFRKAN